MAEAAPPPLRFRCAHSAPRRIKEGGIVMDVFVPTADSQRLSERSHEMSSLRPVTVQRWTGKERENIVMTTSESRVNAPKTSCLPRSPNTTGKLCNAIVFRGKSRRYELNKQLFKNSCRFPQWDHKYRYFTGTRALRWPIFHIPKKHRILCYNFNTRCATAKTSTQPLTWTFRRFLLPEVTVLQIFSHSKTVRNWTNSNLSKFHLMTVHIEWRKHAELRLKTRSFKFKHHPRDL